MYTIHKISLSNGFLQSVRLCLKQKRMVFVLIITRQSHHQGSHSHVKQPYFSKYAPDIWDMTVEFIPLSVWAVGDISFTWFSPAPTSKENIRMCTDVIIFRILFVNAFVPTVHTQTVLYLRLCLWDIWDVIAEITIIKQQGGERTLKWPVPNCTYITMCSFKTFLQSNKGKKLRKLHFRYSKNIRNNVFLLWNVGKGTLKSKYGSKMAEAIG